MRITNKFTIAVHALIALDYFKDQAPLSSEWLGDTINTNPVTVRTVLSRLKAAGIVETRRGVRGATLTRPLDAITFFDIFDALDCMDAQGLYSPNQEPNLECPVGTHIHITLGEQFQKVQAALAASMRQITLADVARGLS